MKPQSYDDYNVLQQLRLAYGPIDTRSGYYPFDHTSYYAEELGASLVRQFLSFEKLQDIESMSEVKVSSNQMEMDFTAGEKRRVNIDPGYITDAKMVLMSAKNLAHRIHIGKGIFADQQLMFRKQTFEPIEFCFPDISRSEVIQYFNEVRKIYFRQLES